MTRVLQSPEKNWSSRSRPADVDRAGVDLTAVERWFFRQGVPQYVYNYWPTDSIEVLFYLLLIVVAFDLSIQPWVSFNPWFLLIAPAVLVFLGLLVRMMIIDPARHLISGLTVKGTIRDRSASINAQLSYLSANRVPLLKLLVSVYVAGCLLFQLGRDVYWTDATFDFVVIAVLLWSAARLFRPEAWAGDDARSRERRRVYAVVAVAVIGFALEGSILPDSREVMDGVLGTIMPSVVPVPQALAALMVTAIIVLQAQRLVPGPSAAGEEVVQQPYNVFYPAVPLLVLVFCAETAILPYLGPVWLAAAVPPAAMAAIAALHVPLRGRRWLTAPGWLKRLDKYPSVRRFIHYPGVTALVGLYLVACPVLVATIAASGEDQTSALVVSDRADARSALLLTFAVNLFYFSLVVAVAVFGLHRVAMWALKEAITDWRRRISNLGRGLSILVVFTALALLTAETWETMHRISTAHYLLLVGSILGLTGAFHLITSLHHLTEISRFKDWSEVRDAARSEQEPSRSDEDAASRSKQDRQLMLVEPVPGSTGAFRLTTYVQHSTKQAELDASSEARAAPAPEPASSEHGRPAPSRNGSAAPDNAIEELLGCDELRDFATSGEAPRRRLDGLAAINTVIVMMTYEIFFFIPATVIAAVVFLVLSHVTVPSPVAANWIYGDRASPTEIGELTRLPFLQQPWPRVALLLTAFSILTLAVDILSDPEKRKLFFGNSDMAIRRRLAVRLAYCEVLAHRKLPEQRYRRPF